jgi:hypothetical protein
VGLSVYPSIVAEQPGNKELLEVPFSARSMSYLKKQTNSY